MKKQIFKLTSILLAMVMVFSLFSIIPISAEGTDLATAVSNFKNAWGNLSYAGFAATQPVGYYNGAGGDFGGQANYATNDATAPAYSSNNYCFPYTTAKANIIYTAETVSSAPTSRMNDYTVSQVSDWVFYYKTEAGVEATYSINLVPYHNNGSDGTPYSGWSGLTLSSTNGEWVRVSVKDWVSTSNIGLTYEALVDARQSCPYLSRLTLEITPSAAGNISFSELGFVVPGYDANLEGTESYTDVQWLRKASELDIDALNAEYLDAADSPTWLAFVGAYNALAPHIADANRELVVEDLRIAAGKMVKSTTSFLYPANKNGDGVLTLNATTDTDRSVYGDYTTTHTFDVVSAIKLGNGIWFAPTTTSGGRTAKYIGEYADAYLTVRVKSAAAGAKLGFWMRTSGSVGSQYDIASNHTVAVESGKTYTIPMADFFDNMAHTNADYNDIINGWREYSLSTATTNKFNATLFCLVATGAVTATVGSIIETENYVPSSATGKEFVAEMAVLDISSFGNTAEFEAARAAALKVYPEVEAEVNKVNSVADLKAAWQSMTYTKNFNLGIGYYGEYKPAGTLTAYAVDDAPDGFAPVPSYKFNYAASAMETGYSLGIDGKTSMVPFKMDQISDIKVWYKSTGDVTARALVYSTDLTNSYDIGTTGAKTLPSTNGKWEQISYIEWFESAFANNTWSDRIINCTAVNNGADTHFATIGFGVEKADVDITFGAMTIVPTINVDLQDSASWSNAQWVVNAFDVDLADYADGDAKETFKSAREAAKGYYTENFAAQDVINASKKLDKLALKPNVYALSGNATQYTTVYDTSNNGDYYATFKGSDGNVSCEWNSGYVEYNTDAPITLADINDLYFSYRVDGFDGDNISARFYIYNEDFGFDTVYDEETGEVVTKGCTAWECRFHSINDGESLLKATADTTDGWVPTSIGTIFGSNWKNSLVVVLNEADNVNGNPNWKDKTAEEIKISAIRLGFNNMATCDISLGSMYVDYVDDSETAITESASNPAAVLEAAREINLSNVNPAQANEFKKLVKALETKINASVKAGYIAGNWYESSMTIKDLSVLSRKNENKLGDTFFDEAAAGSLTEESIRKQLLGIPS